MTGSDEQAGGSSLSPARLQPAAIAHNLVSLRAPRPAQLRADQPGLYQVAGGDIRNHGAATISINQSHSGRLRLAPLKPAARRSS